MKKQVFYLGLAVVACAVLSYSYFAKNDSGTQDAAYEETLAALRSKQKKAAFKSVDKTPKDTLGNIQQLAQGLPGQFQNALNMLQPGKPTEPDPNGQAVYSDSANPLSVPDVIEPTPKTVAQLEARNSVGKIDPFAAPSGLKPFPRPKSEPPEAKIADGKLPPPPNLSDLPKDSLPPPPDTGGRLPPPPGESDLPPEAMSASAASPAIPALAQEELPPPPDRPSVLDRFKLSGIVGDRAILRFRREDSKVKYVTLAEGEAFNNVHLIEIKDDSVVLEEDGTRKDVEIPHI